MMKRLAAALLAVTVIGCTAAQEKARVYRDVAERFAVPDKVRVCYRRDGEVQQGAEYRCFGVDCDLPACPGEAWEQDQ